MKTKINLKQAAPAVALIAGTLLILAIKLILPI